jgi:hypothetical protein
VQALGGIERPQPNPGVEEKTHRFFFRLRLDCGGLVIGES